MADLDSELQLMILDSWGLLYRLHDRAEALRKGLLDDVAQELRSRGLDQGERSLEVSSGYTYVKLPATLKTWTYVQVDVPRDQPSLTVKVWTGFAGATGSYAPAKRHVERFAEQFGPAWQSAPSRVETVRQLIPVPAGGIAGIAPQVAAEVERQLEVAEALRAWFRAQG